MARRIRKTTSFAIIHFSVAFTLSYLLTGNIVLAGALAVLEPMVNTLAFFVHDWVWDGGWRGGESTMTTARLRLGHQH